MCSVYIYGRIYGNVIDLNTICKYPVRERIIYCARAYIAFDNNHFCFIERRHSEFICCVDERAYNI